MKNDVLMRLLLLLMLFALPSSIRAQEIHLSTPKLESGSDLSINWSGAGTSAFITGIGPVGDRGSVRVRPAVSTTYWLIGEKDGAAYYMSASVEVEGQRDVVLPPIPEYSSGARREMVGVSYIEFLDAVDVVLREKWGAQPIWLHRPHEPFFLVVTPRMLQTLDKQSEQRRLAFWVKAYEPANTQDLRVAYELQSLVETRPRNESEFATEKNPAVAAELIEKLDQQIRSNIKRRHQ